MLRNKALEIKLIIILITHNTIIMEGVLPQDEGAEQVIEEPVIE